MVKQQKKKPAKKAGSAAKTPHTRTPRKPLAAETPATDLKTPAPLPMNGHMQPRSSAQARAAGSAMRKALDKEDAVTPGVRETCAGKPPSAPVFR